MEKGHGLSNIFVCLIYENKPNASFRIPEGNRDVQIIQLKSI